MVRIEGTQTIPASLMQDYKGALTEIMPNGVIRKRYPFQVPQLQEGGSRVSQGQARNRNRFKAVKAIFNALNPTQRAELYSSAGSASNPLFYFNYHMQTGIPDNLGHFFFGCDVISQIQNYFLELPTDGTLISLTSVVDPTRCFVVLRGEGRFADIEQTGSLQNWYNVGIKPVVNNLYSSAVSLVFSNLPDYPANVSVQIIEYI